MKRFTESEKWRDPWFRKLPPGAKLAFWYITENCDNAGVWGADRELADFQIGMPIQWEKVLQAFGDRVIVLPGGEWLMTKFVEFQFGKLSRDCKPHLQVIRLIEKHRQSKGYPKGINTLEEKEKDKDKEEEKGSAEGKRPEARPESREVGLAYAKEIGMTAPDFAAWFDHFESNGWRVSGKTPMKDWRAALRNGKRRAPEFHALAAKSGSAGKGGEWLDSNKSAPAPVPPEEAERIAVAAKVAAEAFRKQHERTT